MKQRQLSQRINWVAEAFCNPEIFAGRARDIALEIGHEAIPHLKWQHHYEHIPPPELADQFSGLGVWLAARQRAIFEILFHFRERAIPYLESFAYGEYDWTQGNAIEILCRLAADGIQTESIFMGICSALPELRIEALYYAFQPLLYQAESDPSLKRFLSRFDDVPEYNQLLAELKKS